MPSIMSPYAFSIFEKVTYFFSINSFIFYIFLLVFLILYEIVKIKKHEQTDKEYGIFAHFGLF
jgi:MFS-type transporter involved in bile tolerance (Atg22 family)